MGLILRRGSRPSLSAQSQSSPCKPALLCISQAFSPDTVPTAIRASRLLARLSRDWEVAVLTETPQSQAEQRVRVEVVRGRRPRRLFALLRRLRLAKLLELIVWPDESVFWVIPAILAGRRVAREIEPRAIVVFMMPYSAGLAGIALSKLTGLPLILNLDDSPTCTDMHPSFPTQLHYRAARALEDVYARQADAVIYVSQANLDMVRERQPEHVARKLHLVRYGAEHPFKGATSTDADRDNFEIVYVGAMSGWWTLIEQHAPTGGLKRMFDVWSRLGRHVRTVLDQRTSSPAIIGGAIIDAIADDPDWTNRIRLTIYGNPYPPEVVARALESAGVQGVVDVRGPVAHERIAEIVARADALFLTLPARPDGSSGGRISAKTYEYLATDRPILAAVPRGENWNYLADKPGVWLVDPNDRQRMKEIIVDLAKAKFAGRAQAFDRAPLYPELSYDRRAAQFEAVLKAGIERT